MMNFSKDQIILGSEIIESIEFLNMSSQDSRPVLLLVLDSINELDEIQLKNSKRVNTNKERIHNGKGNEENH